MSGTHQHGPTHSFIADSAMARGVAVKLLASGKVTVAGLNEEYVGWLETPTFADGDVDVRAQGNNRFTVKYEGALG